MTMRPIKPIPNPCFFTAFAYESGIEVLCRSADWYHVVPIERYLYNMAASSIRMEDAKTETRTYTHERFEALRLLIERSAGQEWEVAWEAWVLWGDDKREFGVVHLDQREGFKGDLLIGDDPIHVREFESDGGAEERWTHLVKPAHGPEGSDA